MRQLNVKLFLALMNLTPCVEDVWRSGVIAQLFLTSALDENEWSVSFLGLFNPEI
jgi:hypothetical protein